MKVFLLVSILLLSACKTISNELQSAVAFGVIEELNKLDPDVEKQLLLRLYRAPVYVEGCFKETHGICQYSYFLSVSTFDEYPETNIYKLKTKGEITKIMWLNAPSRRLLERLFHAPHIASIRRTMTYTGI